MVHNDPQMAGRPRNLTWPNRFQFCREAPFRIVRTRLRQASSENSMPLSLFFRCIFSNFVCRAVISPRIVFQEARVPVTNLLGRPSDGSATKIYNGNGIDHAVARWGATDKSDEASTCKRHASSAQRARMTQYRTWFHERRRPPRA